MRGNWVEHTSTTGGAGNLALLNVTGAPGFEDVSGTVGTRPVGYTIREWASGAWNGPALQQEHGVGYLNLATGVLARTKVIATWDGTTYSVVNPSRLSFGTTAANIRVTLAQTADLHPDTLPFYNVGSPAEALGLPSAHHPIGTATLALGASGRLHFTPFQWNGCGDATHVGLAVTTSQAATAAKLGFYEIGTDGLPAALLVDATGGTPVSTAATGPQVVACSFHLPSGWYYACVLGNGTTAAVRAFENRGPCGPCGVNSAGGSIGYLTATGTYATGLPASAPAAGSLTAQTAGGPVTYLRPRN